MACAQGFARRGPAATPGLQNSGLNHPNKVSRHWPDTAGGGEFITMRARRRRHRPLR